MEDVEPSPIMTLDEMRRRYDGEWVLIVDFLSDPQTHEVIRGRVAAHSPDRERVDEVDARLRPKEAAYYFFGDVSGGTVLIL